MSIYAAGALHRFLNPENQPPRVTKFLQEENEELMDAINPGARVVDFGCGTGRHLQLLSQKRGVTGAGFDIEKTYIQEATQRKLPGTRFVVGDCRRPPLKSGFDVAICMNNTLGNITEQEKVIAAMRQLATARIISVYTPDSILDRKEWYRRAGLTITQSTETFIKARDAQLHPFQSYHFSLRQLRELLGEDASIRTIGDGFGYIANF